MTVGCFGRIYLITNTVNVKVYVGQTTKPLALSRYKKVGLIQARALKPGERPEVVGRSRSRTKVWSLC